MVNLKLRAEFVGVLVATCFLKVGYTVAVGGRQMVGVQRCFILGAPQRLSTARRLNPSTSKEVVMKKEHAMNSSALLTETPRKNRSDVAVEPLNRPSSFSWLGSKKKFTPLLARHLSHCRPAILVLSRYLV